MSITVRRLTFILSASLVFLAGCGPQQNTRASVAAPTNSPATAGAQVSTPVAPADPAMAARVKKLAKECADATLKGDYRRVVELSPDSVVSAMGGKEQAIATLTQALAEMAQNGTTFLSFELVGEPGDLHILGQNMFMMVPNVVRMKSNGKNVRMQGYLLAISSDQGVTWKFFDNNALEDPNLRKMVPNLPSSLKIPAPVDPVIED